MPNVTFATFRDAAFSRPVALHYRLVPVAVGAGERAGTRLPLRPKLRFEQLEFLDMLQGLPTFVVDTIRLALWLSILFAIFVPLERLFAVQRGKFWRKGMGADLCYYFVSGQAAALIVSLPLAYAAWAAHRFVPSVVFATVGEAPIWARILGGLVIGEIGFYWGHRLMHEVPFLWRFHAIHHSAERVDFLVN